VKLDLKKEHDIIEQKYKKGIKNIKIKITIDYFESV
jgi:hypothetical protein